MAPAARTLDQAPELPSPGGGRRKKAWPRAGNAAGGALHGSCPRVPSSEGRARARPPTHTALAGSGTLYFLVSSTSGNVKAQEKAHFPVSLWSVEIEEGQRSAGSSWEQI
ncbi:hypothetical protein NDU88_012387 [Pleurodeles waltl]|uniref:Uncharacterized protein n=1 Tax=Pleurodeles waltl TaxID=8319 RepID=A0AAV7R610_PLEWA|nr:hypothetical protein NDU88_012387 [Pleurodeles waltl]